MIFPFLQKIQYIRKNVLGINLRNSEFIFKHNPKSLYPLVDNKILTKDALLKHNIPVPEMYFQIQSYFDLRVLKENLAGLKDFVIKPANGFGGEGVLVITENHKDQFKLTDDQMISFPKIKSHVQDIFSGVYSLNQMCDHALCEYKINGQKELTKLSFKGIPDIRILVFRGIPIMAMLRLSTKKSKGKANLHQGGIGVGIDLVTGITTHAFYENNYVELHPDNQVPLVGFAIPFWEELLSIAARCYEAVPLGYLGVDLVIDEVYGPLVLELNARPGLQIQMANQVGLRKVLAKLQSNTINHLTLEEKISLGKKLYLDSKKISHDMN